MSTSRRDFLSTTATLPLAMAWSHHAFGVADQTRRWKACIIGDSKEGGYGHDFHRVWKNRADVDVVGLADPDAEGRAQAAQDAGAARTYADYRVMLKQEKPDLVSIGPRWTVRHKEYLLACTEIGAHGYLEKPIAVDLVEADAMVAAVEAKNLKWAIGHQKRMCPGPLLLKKLLFKKGLIGDILELRGRGKEDNRAGGEDLIVLGTHIFDLMLFLMGRPQWCVATISVDGRLAGKEDIRQPSEPLGPILGNQIQATFGFENAIPGYFTSRKNKEGYPGRWGLDIYGTRGIVTIRIGRYPEIAWTRTRTWAPKDHAMPWEALPGSVPLAGDQPNDLMNAFVIDDLLLAIQQDREPGVNLASGRDCYEMIQAVYAAHIRGGRIDLPLVERRHPLAIWK
ncbi:MAG: Gfo/Idh/MocA family oxidoreductase [Pirellulales bacterium]|nr:Gfo/Idh/MocA family oxidoreductase [Pirellulales bacterium]